MKSSDYIVEFLVSKGIKHLYGYQGTMISHFVDSVYNNKEITNHTCYNEQGAGFAAVGQAKASGKITACYSTSGPGAANLVSAVADAYYDSTPVLFITGQLNYSEYYDIKGLRQHGFQELDVVSMVSAMTKYAEQVTDVKKLRYHLEKAFHMVSSGRPGPVVLDIPMDIQHMEIDPDALEGYVADEDFGYEDPKKAAELIAEAIKESKKPVLVVGGGVINNTPVQGDIVEIAEKLNIPIATSMVKRDLMPYDHPLNFGHMGGGYGHRYTNLILCEKTDLIVSFGCTLCRRQTGFNTEYFGKNAKIIRVEIDKCELARKLHDDEVDIYADCNEVIAHLKELLPSMDKSFDEWLGTCTSIKEKLTEFDDECIDRQPNKIVEAISEHIAEDTPVCVDIGQHLMWISQSFKFKKGQRIIFSAGHGAMGFAFPASIGAHYADGRPVTLLVGDGSMQMNIQELQWVVREQLPITIFVLNNESLGLIRQQQDDIFNSVYSGSSDQGGYTVPDFCKVARAYGIEATNIDDISEVDKILSNHDFTKPHLFEVKIQTNSMAFPKTFFGEKMTNQRPYISEELAKELEEIK